MRIKQITSEQGGVTQGTLVCEHCGIEERLKDGREDEMWMTQELPAFRCSNCGRNRAGEKTNRKTNNGVPRR